MTLKEIQELVKIINKSDLSEISIEQKEFKITLKREENRGSYTETVQVPVAVAAPAPAAVAPPQPAAAIAPAPPAAEGTESSDDSNLITIKSPMIGTFYRAAGPDKEVFVNVGDSIKQGDVLCMIEAMKLFNEIEAEVSGKIVKVLVENSSPVEYDQALFLVDPAG